MATNCNFIRLCVQALIEKDWLAFGHKFTDRCAFIDGDVREVSPVFTQFLDVVWQLQIQFPTCFEFNEKLLIEMHTQLYQCKYGTFLGNCEKERFDLKLVSFILPAFFLNYSIRFLVFKNNLRFLQ